MFALSALLLAAAVLGGGGRGGLGDLLAQLIAIALLALLCWQGMQQRLSWRASSWVPFLPLLAFALPLLQLLPIPMEWWSTGPARSELAGQLRQVGVSPEAVVSLNPGATEQSLWSLLPATALFLATLASSSTMQRRLLATILLLAAASVALGMAQLAGGPESTLRIYQPTNSSDAVGFFANRNHLACLLAMALPFALVGAVWSITEALGGRRGSAAWSFAACGLAILLLLGIALTRSRAGLLLAMVAMLGVLPMAIGLRRQRGTRRILAVAGLVAVLLVLQFAVVGVIQRMDVDPLEDGRWKYAQVTREAARAYAPLGSGLGTFRQAYQPFEAKGVPDHAIVNHAHNDYLELWLEGGVPALLLLSLAAAIWLWRGVQLWLRNPDVATPEFQGRLVSRVAWLSATLALLHSALDYPLRTTANMAVFAVMVAIAFRSTTRKTTRTA